MTDSEDASVELVQASRRHGSMNSRLRVAERPGQLTDRHNPMLPLG
jgi:hypothetical protein